MTKEEIYLQLTGQCYNIEDEFADGKPCAELYSRMSEARLRLTERVHIDFEDRDLMEIIECLEKIGKICAMKMYDYGVRYGAEPT